MSFSATFFRSSALLSLLYRKVGTAEALTKKVNPEEFIRELEGCITKDAPFIDPIELKKMWEPKTECSDSKKRIS